MRYAIISDIHSNLEALEAVLAVLQEERIDRYLSPGDIVGYGADPAACLERVRSLNPIVVAGNHDWAVAGRLSLDFFNSYARDAVLWTRSMLTRDQIHWLHSLQLLHVMDEITLAHSTLTAPAEFDYLLTAYDAYLSLEKLETRICFVGHSHVPVTFAENGSVTFSFSETIDVKSARKLIINSGSVGQPRDENPWASFGVYDSDTGIMEIRRAEYDIATASRKILQAGLPSILAERLWLGK